MDVRPLVLVNAGLRIMAAVVVVECLIFIMMVLRAMPSVSGPVIRVVFILGTVALGTCAIGAIYLRYGVDGFGFSLPSVATGADPITQLFSLLAIETGALGYFGLQSAWRYVPLTFVLLGVFFLFRPIFVIR
jgi:hypothetical protein